jgi:hypothetical protein
MVRIMKEHSGYQRTVRLLKKPTAVVAALLAGFVGLACSSSSLKTSPGDAGAVGEGQTGGSMSNGSTGGAGGSLGPVGGGGVSASGKVGPSGAGGFMVAGAGGNLGPVGSGGVSIGGTTGSGRSSGGSGTAGNTRTSSSSTGGHGGSASSSAAAECIEGYRCNVGEIVVQELGNADLSKECPAERECYALYNRCTSVLCVLPEGVHCTDTITCNPGDTGTSLDNCTQQSTDCYNKQLCTSTIWCKYATDAGVNASSQDTGTDADTHTLDAGYCGDGIVQADLGEQCDWGAQNGELKVTNICTQSCQLVAWLPW